MNSVEKTALPSILSWAPKGGFAVLDQGLFAGTNFLVNVLLARWLEPAEYGAFAVAYSVFLLLSTFHTAALTEPMLVFGSGKYAGHFRKYMGLLLYGHAGLTGVISLILAIAALLLWQFGMAALAQALFGLAIAAPFILLLWLLRRAFYVRFQPQRAAVAGAQYLVLVITGIYLLDRAQGLSSLSALITMGVAGLLVGLWLTRILQPRWRSRKPNSVPGTVLGDHWRYGRWSSATNILVWMRVDIYYVLLPAAVGLEGSAALRAVMNLLMPILHSSTAISGLLVPEYVKVLKSQGEPRLYHFVRFAFILFVTGSMFYWLFLFLFRYEVVTWLYGGRYSEYADLLILAGLLPLSAGVVAVLGSALRAMERIDQVFWCYVVAIFVALTLGLWLMLAYGLAGAMVGLLASWVATAVAMMCFYIRQNQQIKDATPRLDSKEVEQVMETS